MKVVILAKVEIYWIDENLPDENKIIIFNNGFQLPGDDYSTVDVIDPELSR